MNAPLCASLAPVQTLLPSGTRCGTATAHPTTRCTAATPACGGSASTSQNTCGRRASVTARERSRKTCACLAAVFAAYPVCPCSLLLAPCSLLRAPCSLLHEYAVRVWQRCSPRIPCVLAPCSMSTLFVSWDRGQNHGLSVLRWKEGDAKGLSSCSSARPRGRWSQENGHEKVMTMDCVAAGDVAACNVR